MAVDTLKPQSQEGPDAAGARGLPQDQWRTIVADLNYYNDPEDGSPPAPVLVGSTKVTNERAMISQSVTVTDITGDEGKYTLDSHGFQLYHHESSEKTFDDESKLKTGYFPEMEGLLKRITGASRVFIFDHKVRRGPANWHKLGENNASKRGPLHRVHVDQSYEGAEMVVRWNLPDEADDLLKRRYQIINAWRPVRTALKDPLAVADANSVPESDLVAGSVIYADHRAETWTVKPGPTHRWYFKNEQKPDEVMLIKCFDSVTTVARRVPHCAFKDPDHEDKDARESVEVRALLFHDD